MPSASAATCSVCSLSTWYWPAMFSTLARRTSSNSGCCLAPAEQALEEHTLAQARLGRLQRVEAARQQHPLHDDGAGQDQIRPRGLDARARSRARRPAAPPAAPPARPAPHARSPCPARRWTAGPRHAVRRRRGCGPSRRCPPAAGCRPTARRRRAVRHRRAVRRAGQPAVAREEPRRPASCGGDVLA